MALLKGFLRLSAALILLSAFSCTDNNENSLPDGDSDLPWLSPAGVEAELLRTAEKYPELTALRIIGVSESSRKIYGIEITDKPGSAEAEPAVLIAGGIHGHEQASAGTALGLIDILLESYSVDAGTRALVDNFRINIIPVINPDGLADSSRYNINGVDLNRNFGYNWLEGETSNGDTPFDQAESIAVRDDFTANSYTLALILHTSAGVSGIGIYGPWDAVPTTSPAFYDFDLPNYQMLTQTGSSYSDTLLLEAGYPYSSYFHYEAGADWYVIYGSLNDWALGTHGTAAYSVELYGKQNFTAADSALLENIILTHETALLEIIRAAALGTGGKLLDSDGTPSISAEIRLSAAEGAEINGKTDENGYFRILVPDGEYSISFTMPEETLTAGISVTGGLTSVNTAAAEFYPEYQFD